MANKLSVAPILWTTSDALVASGYPYTKKQADDAAMEDLLRHSYKHDVPVRPGTKLHAYCVTKYKDPNFVWNP